jgi:hypothetical protein
LRECAALPAVTTDELLAAGIGVDEQKLHLEPGEV